MLQGSSFCDRGRLNSRLLREAAFSWRPGTKALTWVKNITNFGRFCYLNIPCLRINITLILYEFFKLRIHALVGKLKNRCFCWFPAAIFVPLKGTQTQSFKIWVKRFSEYLAYEISHRPDSWRGPLNIYLLLFPRLLTFCIEWFAIKFLIAWQWKPPILSFFLWTSWVNSASFLPRYLEYSVRPKKIRTQDTRSVILNVASHNPYGRQLTWQFIKLNWDFIMEKLVLLNLRLLVSS